MGKKKGDSAKSLAMCGLEIVGRDTYGVFPLRGKLLNVREANHDKIINNVELSAVIQILGLQYEVFFYLLGVCVAALLNFVV